jgi:amidophosphoribosyltransferase
MLERGNFSYSAHDTRLAREIPGEKCAVFGVINVDRAATLTGEGLFALQHRGHESSGITSSDGDTIFSHKGIGKVSEVYNPTQIDLASALPGSTAIGHNRYGTYSKIQGERHIQPVLDNLNTLALSHNGNLPDTTRLEAFLDEQGISCDHLNDSEMMHAAIAYFVDRGAPLEDALLEAIPYFTGSFSLLAMDKEKIVAIRDQRGIRPLSIGLLNGGYVFSSETCALDIIDAKHIRDVNPGEMIIAPKDGGLLSVEFSKGEQKLDVFEFVYFARPDSYLLGQHVYSVRKKLGKALWEESRVRGDMVMAVPDSGTPAAMGYAAASGIPLEEGFVKNRYVGRTFIIPGQDRRTHEVRMKLNPQRAVIENKRLVVVDDSIVRGTTSREIVKRLRNAGAREVHMVITCPPIKFPDFYGIDTPNQSALIAANRSEEEICDFIGADSLNFLSFDGMVNATGLPESVFSTSCFTGIYPIDIGKRRQEVSFHPQ